MQLNGFIPSKVCDNHSLTAIELNLTMMVQAVNFVSMPGTDRKHVLYWSIFFPPPHCNYSGSVVFRHIGVDVDVLQIFPTLPQLLRKAQELKSMVN